MRSHSSYQLVFLTVCAHLSLAQTTNDPRAIRQEYCNRSNLCLTSFDWCQPGYCDRSDINSPTQQEIDISDANGADFVYTPGTASLSGVTAFLNPFYNLTWSGNDPAYPVKVDFTFGPPEGSINNTAPLWSRNVTEPYLNFRFRDIFYNLTQQDTSSNISTASYTGYALGWPVFFTISQPDRPATNGLNTTDQSNSFALSDLDLPYLTRRYNAGFEARQAQRERYWRLGVGIGVGVGVPLLLLATFIFGRLIGKKSGRKDAVTRGAAAKKFSESSDGRYPAVAQ